MFLCFTLIARKCNTLGTLVLIDPTQPKYFAVKPGLVPYPTPNSADIRQPVYGDYFPHKLTAVYEEPNTFINNYTTATPTVDVSKADTPEFEAMMYGYGRQFEGEGKIGDVPDGKYIHIQVHQSKRVQSEPFPPFGPCLFHAGEDVLAYDYWWYKMPTFDCADDTPFPCDVFGNYARHETIDFQGATGVTYIGPPYSGYFACRAGYAVAIGQSDNPDGIPEENITLIDPPFPPVVPPEIPVPPVPLRAPPPVMLTGEVSLVDPPTPPSVTTTNNTDGTVTVDYTFVCCPGPEGPGGADAVQPTFAIGTVEVVPIEDAYVHITGGPIDFVFDFGIPAGGDVALEAITIPLSLINAETGEPEIIDTVMYGVTDGDHNQASFISAIFNQFAQIRNNEPVFKQLGEYIEIAGNEA